MTHRALVLIQHVAGPVHHRPRYGVYPELGMVQYWRFRSQGLYLGLC